MADQALNTSLSLSTPGTVNGIFGLNNTQTTSVNFDDTSVASSTVEIVTGGTEIYAVGITDVRYVYISNTSGADSVEIGEASGTKKYANLGPGEWMFLPVNASMGVKGWTAAGKTAIVQYAWFTKV